MTPRAAMQTWWERLEPITRLIVLAAPVLGGAISSAVWAVTNLRAMPPRVKAVEVRADSIEKRLTSLEAVQQKDREEQRKSFRVVFMFRCLDQSVSRETTALVLNQVGYSCDDLLKDLGRGR